MIEDLCHVVRFDPDATGGCGRSDWDGNYDLDRPCWTDAEAVRAAHSIERCIVAGRSSRSFGPDAARSMAYASSNAAPLGRPGSAILIRIGRHRRRSDPRRRPFLLGSDRVRRIEGAPDAGGPQRSLSPRSLEHRRDRCAATTTDLLCRLVICSSGSSSCCSVFWYIADPAVKRLRPRRHRRGASVGASTSNARTPFRKEIRGAWRACHRKVVTSVGPLDQSISRSGIGSFLR